MLFINTKQVKRYQNGRTLHIFRTRALVTNVYGQGITEAGLSRYTKPLFAMQL